MSEDKQAREYYNQIEEEEEFDDEIEESEEETITLDFDKGIAIQEGVVVGEGLFDAIDRVLTTKATKAKTVEEQNSQPIVAKAMTFAYETPEGEPLAFSNLVEMPEGFEEASKEAELVEKVAEKVKEEFKPASTYQDKLMETLVGAIAGRAVKDLMNAHYALETELYDELEKKHRAKLGGAFRDHQQAMLKSIDKKKSELRKAYGINGRVSPDHIPDWAKPAIEEYFKNFVYNMCDLMGDVE